MVDKPEETAALRKYKTSDHLKRTSNQLQRLDSALSVAERRIASRKDAAEPAVTAGSAVPQPTLAREFTGDARKAWRERDPDVGWACLHSALELEVMAYGPVELRAVGVACTVR